MSYIKNKRRLMCLKLILKENVICALNFFLFIADPVLGWCYKM